ncbi:MAG: hypothetical protein GY775_17970 [Candidatus Scalindua sp.]|nr:hypothetical protein [Candidatus Scalindua sp.]
MELVLKFFIQIFVSALNPVLLALGSVAGIIYSPLHERTKTLKDVRVDDSTENRENAEPYIKRYEEKRQRIMNNRN